MALLTHPRTGVQVATAACALASLFVVLGCSAAGGDDVGGPGAAAGGGAGGGSEGATPSVHPPAGVANTPPEDGLALLNEYRALAGLAPVQADDSMSAGCVGHLEYLIWEASNDGKGTCFLSHTEDNHDNPSYTPENEAAGKDSVIACGYDNTGRQSLAQAVDGWMNTLYHRLPLLHPGLHSIGYASKDGYNCINYRTGTDLKAKVELDKPVVWPPDAMSEVPRSFAGFEFPCPTKIDNPLATNGMDCAGSGFILTASWYGWGVYVGTLFTVPEQSNARLIDETTNAEIPLLAWYADGLTGHDPARNYVHETVAWIPAASLPPNETYRAEFDGVMRNEPVSARWRFTTGTRDK